MHTRTAVVATPATSGTVVSPATPDAATNHSVATACDSYAARRAHSARVEQVVYLVFGVIGGLLVVPFLLRALGANPDAGFAQAVYAITGVLVAPFSGLFGAPHTLELCTLVALIVYAGLAGYWPGRPGSSWANVARVVSPASPPGTARVG